MTEHQASGLTGSYDNIGRNVFYPISSEETPVIYDKIHLIYAVDQASDKYEKQLEHYVNSFFTNPLLKESQRTTSGSIIFTEGVKTTVRYSDNGVLEFKKTSNGVEDTMTSWEKLDLVGKFIEECTGISENEKRGVYLKEISQNDAHQTVYKFGYKYNGYEVILSEPLKKQLGIDEFLELTVKNNQVVQGRWLVFNAISTNGTAERFTESIDDMMDYTYVKQGTTNVDYLQCAYVIKEMNEPAYLHWIAEYKNKWWYK